MGGAFSLSPLFAPGTVRAGRLWGRQSQQRSLQSLQVVRQGQRVVGMNVPREVLPLMMDRCASRVGQKRPQKAGGQRATFPGGRYTYLRVRCFCRRPARGLPSNPGGDARKRFRDMERKRYPPRYGKTRARLTWKRCWQGFTSPERQMVSVLARFGEQRCKNRIFEGTGP